MNSSLNSTITRGERLSFDREIFLRSVIERVLMVSEGSLRPASLVDHPAIPEVLRAALRYHMSQLIHEDLASVRAHFERSQLRLAPKFEQALYPAFSEGLLETARFDASQLETLLQKSTRAAFDAAQTPIRSLINLIKRDATIQELENALQLVTPYEHLYEVLSAWLARRKADGVTNLSTREFEQVVRSVDEAVLSRLRIDRIALVAQPLFDLFSFAGSPRVPRSVLATAFLDRSLDIVAVEILAMKLDEFSQYDLEIAAANAVGMSGRTHDPEPEYDSFLTELRGAGVVLPPSRKIAASLHQTELESIAGTSSKTTRSSAQVQMTRASAQSSATQIKLAAALKKRVIKTIFAGDESDYETTMTSLSQATTTQNAFKELESLFRRRKIDPSSKLAVQFADQIYTRFAAKS